MSGKKYEVEHKQATKKLGAGQKQHEAAIKLQKNVRIYLQSTRRMLGGHHVFTKAFMEYGTREGPEGFLVGYGYDPARDSLVKKRMGSKEFLAFVLECELYGGGQMGTKDVAEKIFTEQYTLQNKKQEKQLRDREIREGIRRGSLKFEPRKEVDYPIFKLCMEKLCVSHYKSMGLKNAVDRACRMNIIPKGKKFEAERKAQRLDQLQSATLTMLKLAKEGSHTSEKAANRNSRLASSGKRGKHGKGGIKATKRTAIQ